MKTHELAKLLLELPDGNITISSEIETDEFDQYGDGIVAKLISTCLIEVIDNSQCNNEVILHFEKSESELGGVDIKHALECYLAEYGIESGRCVSKEIK